MVKRDALEKIGRFSTEYFMYAEEMDLCYKLRASRLQELSCGRSRSRPLWRSEHKKEGTGFSDVLMRESVFKLLNKFRGNMYAQLYRTGLFLSAMARMTLLLPLFALRTCDRQPRRYCRHSSGNGALLQGGV